MGSDSVTITDNRTGETFDIPIQNGGVNADTWRKLVPHADIRIYKGAGHLVHLEKPEAADAIAKFLG